MHLSWLEAAGRLSLSCYLFVMCGLLMAMIVRMTLGHSWLGSTLRPGTSRTMASPASDDATLALQGRPPTLEDRVRSFFFEYFGNLSPLEEELHSRARPLDRRRNLQARAILDRIKEQMEEGGFPARDEEQFMENLREVVRREEVMVFGDRVTETLEDSPLG